MPALPNVPGVIKTIFKHGWDTGEQLFNILFWAYTGTNSDAAMSALAAELAHDWVTDLLSAYLNNHVTLNEIELIDLTSPTSPSLIDSTSYTGTETDGPLPASASLVISHEIARRYRGGHPRTYLGGHSNNAVTNGIDWVSSYYPSLLTHFGTFVEHVKLDGPYAAMTITDLVNVSYFTDHALRVTPVVDVITDMAARPRVCSQRRRLGKLGG